MIDWARPLVGRGIGCPDCEARIDSDFAKKPGVQFVRLSRNAWLGAGAGGTWAFNDDGLAVAGMGPQGYEGRFVLENE